MSTELSQSVARRTVVHDDQSFTTYTVTHPSNTDSKLVLYEYGAHITQWSISGHDVLYCSKQAVYQIGKGIRDDKVRDEWSGAGHVDTGLAQHGFARTSVWEYVDSTNDHVSGDVTVTMKLQDNDYTRKQWNYKFTLLYKITLHPNKLSLQLQCTNTNQRSFDFCNLLHSYLSVTDIQHARISGLDQVEYIDKVRQGQHDKQQNDLTINGETDRIYCRVSNNILLNDGDSTQLNIQLNNFVDAVVWNPWIDKAKSMNDMGDQDFKQFVCIEPGNVSQPITLQSNQTHTASVTYTLNQTSERTPSSSHL